MQLSSSSADPPSSAAPISLGALAGAHRRAGPPLVRLRGASIGYDQSAVLHEADFSLEAGQAVAVLGPNGAGKSTLIRGILGLADIVAGSVELFGLPRSAFKQWHRLGYVPQSHGVASGIPSTVREVVASGRLARKGLTRRFSATDRNAVEAAIDIVGLSDRIRHPVGTLSGGQQRRVLIARALAGEPDLLVLDE
ncbi:MAG: metal ABC transporter ATP-binding protein, partial [Actinomycetota bacterium]|nr:metal ABC transporter ATP-binding protein [Actinomycetota bacterium]